MKVVLVATSASTLGSIQTGVWLEELAAPYYEFEAKGGYDISIASPKGGPIPIDAGSLGEGFFTDEAKKFMHDATAMGMLCHSVPIGDVTLDDVDAIFMAGGHGTCTDFINCPTLKAAIESMYKSGKIVASVCHGPICLTDCENKDGTPLVQGVKVTGFTNTEEHAVQKQDLVPFMLEDKLKELGGIYERADDWNSKVVVDGNIVTGQNPQSSKDCAKKVIELLL